MARVFDGTDDRISWANVFVTSATAFTFSAWLRPNNVNRSTQQYIWHGEGAASAVATVISIADNTQAVGALRIVRIASVQGKNCTTAADTIALNKWQHITVIDDGSLIASGCRIFVNGRRASMIEELDASGTETTANGVWVLGGRTADNARNLDGYLADVAVWRRQLTMQQVVELAQGMSPLRIANDLRFYAPLGYPTETNLVGAASTTTVGSSVTLSPVPIIQPSTRRRHLMFVEAAAAAGHPAMRRLGGVRYGRDIPVRVPGVRTF